MGVIKPGVLGNAKGKVGNLIFYEVNGQLRVRQCPGEVKNPRSPKQTAQRTRMKGIADLYGCFDWFIYYNWKSVTEGTTMNGYNLFMSCNIRNLDGNGEIIDHSQLWVTKGDLLVPRWVKMEAGEGGKMLITWDTAAGDTPLSENDRLQIAVHTIREDKSDKDIMVATETQAERRTGRYEWTVPEQVGKAHVYGFFKGKYEDTASDSFYLGSLGMEMND